MKRPIACSLALALSLMACAQEPTGRSPGAALGATPRVAQQKPATPSLTEPVRVVVQFKNPAAIDAQGFVQRLQTLTPAPVRYVAAASVDTHVYILQPAPGHSTTQLLQQLGAMPEIARAEFDQKTRGH